jgi:hypothetical protein
VLVLFETGGDEPVSCGIVWSRQVSRTCVREIQGCPVIALSIGFQMSMEPDTFMTELRIQKAASVGVQPCEAGFLRRMLKQGSG